MRLSLNFRAILSSLRSVFDKNKKVIICTLIVFVIGISAGILSVVRSVSDGFERVPKADMEFSGAKVFFISSLALLGAYVIFLLAGINSKTVVLALIPFFVLGFILGEYATALVARYETTGVLNLILIYLPFFIGTLGCFLFCACLATYPQNGCATSGLKPSFVSTLKLFGINLLISLVFFLIIGSIFGVIVVEQY